MEEVFIGIDASFTGTGLIALNSDGKILDQRKITTKSVTPVEERIISITKGVVDFINNNWGNHINLEAVFVGRNPKKALQSGGLHYYLRIALFESGHPLEITPPTQLKKFVTKKGNCKKELMMLKTFRRWGIEFEDNDLCDAYGLARMILDKHKEKEKVEEPTPVEQPTGTIRRSTRRLPS